eukprot:COSAG01_NODE_337_length_18678_cov_21.905969_12_plen_300_part_00
MLTCGDPGPDRTSARCRLVTAHQMQSIIGEVHGLPDTVESIRYVTAVFVLNDRLGMLLPTFGAEVDYSSAEVSPLSVELLSDQEPDVSALWDTLKTTLGLQFHARSSSSMPGTTVVADNGKHYMYAIKVILPAHQVTHCGQSGPPVVMVSQPDCVNAIKWFTPAQLNLQVVQGPNSPGNSVVHQHLLKVVSQHSEEFISAGQQGLGGGHTMCTGQMQRVGPQFLSLLYGPNPATVGSEAVTARTSSPVPQSALPTPQTATDQSAQINDLVASTARMEVLNTWILNREQGRRHVRCRGRP